MTENETCHSHESVLREEQVAEAVLLALGPRLEWDNPVVPTIWESNIFFKGGSVAWYRIFPSPDAPVATECYQAMFHNTNGQDDLDPTEKRRLSEAKAACERHYATGKWE